MFDFLQIQQIEAWISLKFQILILSPSPYRPLIGRKLNR
jgi:hypothetical protein